MSDFGSIPSSKANHSSDEESADDKIPIELAHANAEAGPDTTSGIIECTTAVFTF